VGWFAVLKKLCQAPFLWAKKPVLWKKLWRKKVRKPSEYGVKDYVNAGCIFHRGIPVENPCGKACGKCGKVLFFHR
jgi:hypothetical protein